MGDKSLLELDDLNIENHLTEKQKEQLRFFEFKHLISINDEDLDTGSFGDKYHIINMYGFCVGVIAINDYGTTTVEIELNEELNSITYVLHDYCEQNNITLSKLLKILNIKSVNQIQYWAYYLIELSVDTYNEDELNKFINSAYYNRNSKDNLYKELALNHGTSLPKDLIDYFNEYYRDQVCPICGAILVYTEWEEYDTLGDGSRVHLGKYICNNCNHSVDSLDKINEHSKPCSITELNNIAKIHMNMLSNSNAIYSFEDIKELLENLSESDKEKVKNYKFKMHKEYPDDDSGDIYYYITILKDNIEVGKIDMLYNSNKTWDLIINEMVKNGEPSYSYTMELNEEQSSNEEDKYIEALICTECLKQTTDEIIRIDEGNDIDTEEIPAYKGSKGYMCDHCNSIGTVIKVKILKDQTTYRLDEILKDENFKYTECNSCKSKIEHKYWDVIDEEYISDQGFGGIKRVSIQCPVCKDIKVVEDDNLFLTDKYKNKKHNTQDVTSSGADFNEFDTDYLYNTHNLYAIHSNELYNYSSDLITNIFNNTSYADFNIDSIKDCKFKVLDCSVLNESVEDNIFDTPTIAILLQVIRNNKILGYIKVEQQYPLDKAFAMFEVKKGSDKKLIELCKAYTSIYTIKEDTSIMLSKSRTDGFNTPVCKKCGQVFCDCNLRCSICGKIFCEHKYS